MIPNIINKEPPLATPLPYNLLSFIIGVYGDVIVHSEFIGGNLSRLP
jgi:hypothetical protein